MTASIDGIIERFSAVLRGKQSVCHGPTGSLPRAIEALAVSVTVSANLRRWLAVCGGVVVTDWGYVLDAQQAMTAIQQPGFPAGYLPVFEGMYGGTAAVDAHDMVALIDSNTPPRERVVATSSRSSPRG